MNEPSRDQVLRLSDGRTLGWREYGAPSGSVVFMLHGTPGSRLKFTATKAHAHALGLRIIAPDRWGYGLTSTHPRPTLTAFATDLARIADHLAIDTFAVAAVSGGGPFAVAVAAGLAGRVSATALISPVGPIANANVVLAPFHRFCFTVLPRWPQIICTIFGVYRRLIAYAPTLACRLVTAGAPQADRAIMQRPDVAARLLASFAEGLRPGSAGPAIDMVLFSRPWEIDFAAIAAPVRLWLGSDDVNVPATAAKLLTEGIKGCERVDLVGEGHLWVALNYREVLGWVAMASLSATKDELAAGVRKKDTLQRLRKFAP
jgi:pimeloyl-ACP methyl ester carboxylesterase